MGPLQGVIPTHCPDWLEFLEQVQPDEQIRTFIQRWSGYSLTGETREQKLILNVGSGANGKSTFSELLLAMLGDYGQQAAPEVLLAAGETHPTGLADLKGARFVVSAELEEGRRLAEATVKKVTGGDRIKARFMRQDFFEFTPTHKLWLHTNHKPVIRGTDHAIWRRLRLIHWGITIPDHCQDKTLPERLRDELPGVLAWAVRGCLDWQQQGLTEPEAIRIATSRYRADMDTIGEFIDDLCMVGSELYASAAALYGAYTQWCDDTGETSLTQRRLGMALTERGFERRKYGTQKHWHWFGLGIIASGSGALPDPEDGEATAR